MSIATTAPLWTGSALQARTAGPDLTRYMLVCGALLAAILVLAWLFKRFVAGALKRRAAQRFLRVVDVLPLGGKQKLVVVRCYDRSFLLGLGEKEISSIAELDVAEVLPSRDEPPAAGPDAEPEEAQAAPFRSALEDAVSTVSGQASGTGARPALPWEDAGGILA